MICKPGDLPLKPDRIVRQVILQSNDTEGVMFKTTTASVSIGSLQDRMTIGVVALLLGSFMLLGIGFAHSETIHNAAHDTRHALTFPCH